MSQVVFDPSDTVNASNHRNSMLKKGRASLLSSTALVLGLLLAVPQTGQAQTWDGQTDTNWSVGTNWNPDGTPNSSAIVTINNGGLTNQPTVNTNQTVLQTNVSAGTLTVSATLTSAVAASGTGTVIVETTRQIVGNVTMNGTSLVTNSGTVTGNITINAGTFNNAGTVTGNTTVLGGTLNLNTGTNLADAGALTVDLGTVDVNASDSVGMLSGTGGTIDIDAGQTLTTTSATNHTYAGNITGQGALTKNGAGTLTLTGTNSVATTTISTADADIKVTGTGTLTSTTINIAGATNTLNTDGGALNAAVEITGDGTLEITGNESVGFFTGFFGDMDIGTGSTLTLTGGGTSEVTGEIRGDGGLTFDTDTDEVRLAGADGQYTYTGATKVLSGNVIIGHSGASTLASTEVDVSGGTLNDKNGSLNAGTDLTISGTGTVDVANADTITSVDISGGTLQGAGTLTVTGTLGQSDGEIAGTVNVAGAKNLDGGTISGTLGGAGATTIQTGTTTVTGTINGNVTVGSGGTLRLDSATAVSGTITTTGSVISYADGMNEGSNIILNSDTTQLEVLTGDAATQSGVISETGGARPLEKIGDGKLTVTGANTYTGLTTISAGVLNVQNVTGLGTTAAGTTVVDGAALEIQGGISIGAEALTLNGSGISGGGALRNISGDNSISGNITLGSAAQINSDANTLTLSGTITNAGNTLTVGGAGNTALNGAISGLGGLTKNGTGTTTLGAANLYAGATTVNAGKLTVTGSIASSVITVNNAATLEVDGAAIADTAAITLNDTSTLNLTGSETIGSLTGAAGSSVTLGANTLTTGGDNTSTSYAGTISSTGGGLTKAGTGTFTLTHANSYTGATSVSAGVLNVQNATALGTAAAGTSVTSGAALQLEGGITIASEALTLSGGGIVVSSVDTGALRNVSGNNTYNGNITLGDAARINADSGTTLTLGGTVTNAGNTLTVGGAGNTALNGVISGLGGLTKDGAGTATLGAANLYSGATTVNAGKLTVTGSIASSVITVNNAATLEVDGAAIADTAAITLNNTSTLNLTGSETIGSLTGAAGSSVTLGANTLTTGGDNTSTSYAGVISETGGLIKEGTGTFTLTGANSFSGAVDVNGGTLAITGSGSLAATDLETAATATLSTDGSALGSTVSITNAGNFALTGGGDESIAAINGSGNIALSNGSVLTLNTGASVIGGVISGNGGLTIAGTSATTLNGANTYVGGTTVNAGSLTLGANNVLSDDGDVTLNGGTITANITDTIDTLTQTAGTLTGTGTLTADGGFVQSGGTTGGTITINTTTFDQSGGATIALGTTVSASGDQTLASGTIAGNLSGAGAVTVQTGTTALTGAITAATTVVSGTLTVTAGTITGAAENDGGTITVVGGTFTGGLTNTDGTLNLAGSINGNITNDDTANATAATTFTAGNTYTNSGTTSLSLFGFSGLASVTNEADGIINVGSGITLSATSISNLADGSIFINSGTVAGAFSNAGILGVNGAGIITGSLVNTGQVTLLDGAVGDTLTISGPVSGGGIYALDINLDNGTTDKIIASGDDATGLIQLAFDPILTGDGTLLPDIVVFDGVAAGATISQTGLPTGGAILYGVSIDGSNIEVNSTINPAVAGVAAGAAVTQSLIGTVVNRPTSPFVSGLALEESCSSGGYLRASAGQASITGTSTNNNITNTSTVDTRFSGVQGGADIGCYDGRFFNGWDGAIGVMAGYNNGSTLQGVYSDPINKSVQTGTSASDFNQTYAGLYLAGSKDRISGDVQLRFDHTQFDLSETAILPYLPIGLDGLSYATDSTTFGTRLNYRFDVNEDKGINFIPTIGFNYTSTTGATLTLNDGNGTLEITPFNTVVGFVGGTLTKTKIGEDGQSATTTFISGNYYKDFGGDRLAIFDNATLDPTDISLGSLGGFAEASIGVNYVKVLEKGPAGAKQLNANLRADARFGDNVSDSYSLTAQVRLSF